MAAAMHGKPLLAAAAAVLVALAVYPWFAPIAAPDEAAAPQRRAATAAVIKPLPPFASFAAVLERPLFSPSRRPAPEAEATAGAAPLASRLRLLGIIAIGGDSRALVADGKRRIELVEGALLDGYTVRRIGQDEVILSSPGGEARLKLRQTAGRPASPAPASR